MSIDPDFDGPRRTICQVLREAHRLTKSAKIHELLDEAHGMAKAMDAKLRSYRLDWDAGFWPGMPSEGHAEAMKAGHAALPRFGIHGYRWAKHAVEMTRPGATILDYGCGKSTFAAAMHGKGRLVREYDPGIPGKDTRPEPADLVLCTDVLPFVERERLADTIADLERLALKALFVAIPYHPAEKLARYPGVAHIVLPPEEWQALFTRKVKPEMIGGGDATPYLLLRWSA